MLVLCIVAGLLITTIAAASPGYWWFVLAAAVARPGARFGPRLTVTAQKVLAPRLAQLSRGRVAMVWAARRKFAGALYRPRAGLRKLPAPPGHPPKGASTISQWFDGAGAHGVLVWIRRGRAQASILTIG